MGKYVDLTGNVYGELTVLERSNPIVRPNGRKVQTWLCKCTCGKTIIVRHGNLTSGNTISCGCVKSKETSKRILDDIVGNKYGELTVIKRASEIGGKRVKWLCQCTCGHTCVVEGPNLKQGNTTSCGCMKNSEAESMIQHILDVNNIKYEKEKKYSDLLSDKGNPFRFDFAIYTSEKDYFLLEYQGVQHFVEQADGFGKYEREYSDKLKYEYCKNNNIEIVYITYKEDIDSMLTKILNSHNLLHDNTVPSSQETV